MSFLCARKHSKPITEPSSKAPYKNYELGVIPIFTDEETRSKEVKVRVQGLSPENQRTR